MKTSLPIDEFLPEIGDKLLKHSAVVVTAAPGAGKTTRLPVAALDWVKGKVLVLEPRRMAAIAAASRIAEENSWEAGQQVGWQVRFDNQTTSQTRLIFLTEALLARRMISDPELEGVDLVILDEFHERSFHTDLTLGLLQELRQLGRNLKLIVMSATLGAEKLSDYLEAAPIVSVPGKLFELSVQHAKQPQRLRTDDEFYVSLTETIKQAQKMTSRDLLVFLPGVREIGRTQERLAAWAQIQNVQVLPLHGSLPLEEQRRVLRKGSRQRVILSTNLAESSVTLDGVDTVVDSGLSKVNRYDLKTGFHRLELGRISKNSAIQRAGRAARQFPGRVFKMWTLHDEASMPQDELPEILRADLSEALLFLSKQGVRNFEGFSWFEAPAKASLQSAERGLKALQALGEKNELTPRGEKLLRFPLAPRWAALLVEGEERDLSEGGSAWRTLAAEIAALLQERDSFQNDLIRSHLGDRWECDVSVRLHLLRQGLGPTHSFRASLRQLLGLLKIQEERMDLEGPAVRRLLLSAFPDRLARRRSLDSEKALMVGGRGLKLAPQSLVKDSEFLIALQGIESGNQSETTVGLACGLSKEFVLKELGPQLLRSIDLTFDETKKKIFQREYRSYQDLPVDDPTLSVPSPELLAEQMPTLAASRFDEILKMNEALAGWLSRWRFLQRQDEVAAGWNWDEARLRSVFAEAAYGENSLPAVAEKDLVYFFEKSLPQEFAEKLREIPDRIQVPTGNKIRVIYPDDKSPYIEVRLQEIFGWQQTPMILQRVPVTIHLLGPNFRPVQVTSDLASFWQNAYPEVRKELRSRYPKHSWPEDPLTAPPVAKGRPRT